MNKIFSKIAVLAVGAGMAIGVGVAASKDVARADAVDHVFAECDFTLKTAAATNYTSEWEYGDYLLNGCANNNGGWAFVKFGKKKTKSEDPAFVTNGYVKTKNPLASEIIRIDMTIQNSSVTNATVTWSVDVASDAAFTSIVAHQDGGTLTHKVAGTYSINASSSWGTGNYYRVNIDVTNDTTTNGVMFVESVKFIEDVQEQPITGITVDDLSLYVGNEEDVVVTAEPTGAVLPSDLTYNSSDSSVFTVDAAGHIVAKGPGTATLTVDSASKSVSDTATVTVNGYPESVLVVGEELILVATGSDYSVQFNGMSDNGKYGKAVSYSGSPATTNVLEVCETPYAGAIALKLDDKYLSWASGNELNAVDNIDLNSSWVVTKPESEYVVVNAATYGSSSPRYLRYNSTTGQERFACYLSGQNPVSFAAGHVDPYFEISASKTALLAGDTATITSELFAGATGIVSYSNSNESVLTLVDNGDGTATVTAQSLPTNATATITGTLAGCAEQSIEFSVQKDVAVNGIVVVSGPTKDTYYVDDSELSLDGLVVNKTYTDGTQDPVDIADLEFDFDFGQVGDAEVTVTYLTFGTTFHVNVIERPVTDTMTVAEALDAIAALDEPEAGKSTYGANVTVHGFVTSKGSWSDQYSNADVYMADVAGGTPTLQVFRFADKATFDLLVAGTEINAFGQLAKFKDKSGNIKPELTAPKDGAIAIEILNQPTIDELTVEEALERAALIPDPTGDKETKTDSKTVTVHGFVTSKGSWSEQYGNADVYMADDASSSTTLQIFRFSDKTTFDQLMVGSEIKATGTLAKYRKDSSTPISIEFTGVAIEIISTPTILELSVAEALERAALIPDPTGDKETKTDSATVKVHGFVVSLGSWSDQYGNADVYMADVAGGTPTLQVFRFSDKTIFDQLMVGTEINATGILAKYRKDSSTPISIEFTGAAIEILSQPTIDELSVAEALERAALIPDPTGDKETKTDSASVKVHGYVVRINAWSGQYGNTDVYIADEVNGTTTLQVFRFGDVDVYKQLALGAEVKVLGTLAKYRKDADTPISIEFTNPQIEIISSPLVESLSFADAYTKVQGLDEPASGGTTYDTVNVKVQGYVVSKSSWDETYKDGSLYISDTASGTNTIQLYKVFEKDVFDAAEVGAKVEATGILAKNKSNAGVIKLEMSAVVVTVLEAPIPTVTGMTIEGAPKTTYYVGESIDLTGITKFVIAYSDGTTADKTLGDVVLDDSLFDTSAEGDGIIAFDYTEADPTKQGSAHAEYAVTVIPAPVPCTIIFDNNGGTGTMEPITGKNVGDVITLPSADSLTAPAGQQFKAWEIDGAEYLPGASYTLSAAEVTIKALWEDIPAPAPTLVDIVVTPTVFEYGLNGVIDKDTLTVMGSFSDSTERELASNEYVLIYDFSAPGDDVVVTVDAGEGVVATYNVTVTDTPAPTPCTIEFDLNGGTGTMTPIEGKSVGQSITLPSADSLTAPAGKEFDAWQIDGVRYLVGASYTLASDVVTIKALWKDIPTPVPCTISFDLNGGTGTMAPITGKNVGDTITLPSAATLTAPAGKEFKAWEINGVEYAVGASYELASATVTIKALWKDATPVPPAPKTLTGIEVTPTVFEYNVGDVIDKSTITVVAIYSDGSRETIAASQFEALINTATAGDSVAVTINYGGKTYTYNVSVKAVEEAKKGCRGSVVATSAILSILSLAGVALLSVKKRKED